MKDMKVIQIDDKISAEYEVAKVLRKYPKDTVMLTNVKGYDIPVVSGICNTREKIAKSLNCEVSEITAKVIDGMNNPRKVTNFIDIKDEYTTKRANLEKIPILTHYKRDGGAIFIRGGSISNCIFTNCKANDDGGAIAIWDKTGTISNCNFTNCHIKDNDDDYDGGAIYLDKGGTVSGCNFLNCSHDGDGEGGAVGVVVGVVVAVGVVVVVVVVVGAGLLIVPPVPELAIGVVDVMP